MVELPKKRYAVMQYRWIRDSTQNGTFQVARPHTRLKNAKGDCKTLFLSQLEMMLKHDIYGPEIFVDEEDFSVTVEDEHGPWFISKFFVQDFEVKGG